MFVYLIKNGVFYKIGKSENPEARLKQLKTATPNSLELIDQWEVTDRWDVEKFLHDSFYTRQVSGEWFFLSEKELIELGGLLASCGVKFTIGIDEDLPQTTRKEIKALARALNIGNLPATNQEKKYKDRKDSLVNKNALESI